MESCVHWITKREDGEGNNSRRERERGRPTVRKSGFEGDEKRKTDLDKERSLLIVENRSTRNWVDLVNGEI